MKPTLLFGGAAALLLTTAAQAQPRTPMPAPMPVNSLTMAPDFVETAAASDLFERESGELAQRKGQNPQVRQFGAQMAAEHTRMSQMLAAAAGQARQPAPRPKLSPGQRRMIEELERADGADFDKLYLQQQHQSHKDALGLMQSYARLGESPPLKSLAATGAPVVEGHLEMIKRMQNGR